MTPRPPTQGTLADIRVVDLTRVLAGPFAAMVPDDLFAGVITVEAVWRERSRRQVPRAAGVLR